MSFFLDHSTKWNLLVGKGGVSIKLISNFEGSFKFLLSC